ncbi:nitrate ABC transporter substrate-binding protein [Skermanella stibiiresistens SB22]|uniref:Nitrate ABC transporter substrate-binding protein n=1 Tax=Skermanella stibiiresistens SB22 TaxID=1385369 RepID=W9GUH6_9PROT|nr:ABC transporter substrate-binding protein [Skermanella stibiiresistens]EWY37560.1 nitrate ABC transporter substrate-binding protein [Skermanella stibiiresistens SB22]
MAFKQARRRLIGGVAVAALSLAVSTAGATAALAADKLVFLTSWFAQAEHGGFYQALATGAYEKVGLDVTIKMGGPQVNGMQLLVAGEADAIMGYDIQTLKAVENKLPVVTVAASFQYDLQGLMTHPDIGSLEDLKGRKILIATASRNTFWPWLRAKYGFEDQQAAPYTFNLQPFLVDPKAAVQAYPSSEPFEARQQGKDVKFLLLADAGYPPYGTTIVTTRGMLDQKPDVMRRFVKATMEGWKSYLANPAPANELIKRDNSKMTDERMAFAVDWLRTHKAVNGGDAAAGGIGTMTEARWKQTYDFLVSAGLLNKETDWKRAFTTDFVRDLQVTLD